MTRAKAIVDTATGKAKRIVGEIIGRPDIVLEGEAQQTKGLREKAAAERANGSDRS